MTSALAKVAPRDQRADDAQGRNAAMIKSLSGALVGWKRTPSAHGIVLTLQIADTADRFKRGDYDRVDLALNDRQLRSLARDLARAAGERGIELTAPRRWWQRARD